VTAWMLLDYGEVISLPQPADDIAAMPALAGQTLVTTTQRWRRSPQGVPSASSTPVTNAVKLIGMRSKSPSMPITRYPRAVRPGCRWSSP
jgi:hypothetical protein